jgi:hypothetical protein
MPVVARYGYGTPMVHRLSCVSDASNSAGRATAAQVLSAQHASIVTVEATGTGRSGMIVAPRPTYDEHTSELAPRPPFDVVDRAAACAAFQTKTGATL